jgi:hypothetical protein
MVDMYHTHEAPKRHDKIYALLGMSSDNLSKAGLSPNYQLPWAELLERLVTFLLGDKISVKTWGTGEVAIIKSKGYILGTISSVQSNTTEGGKQGLDVLWRDISGQKGYLREWSAHWTIQVSAKSVRKGDLICLLQGVATPTIIRVYEDFSAVIIVSATPPQFVRSESGYLEWPEVFQTVNLPTRELILVWDWENSVEELYDLRKYDVYNRSGNWTSEKTKTDSSYHLDIATRLWKSALLLGDANAYKTAEARFREAVEILELAFRDEWQTIKDKKGLSSLQCAVGNGYGHLINLLLLRDYADRNLIQGCYGKVPLSWAAEGGHKAVVKLLLETSEVDVNFIDKNFRTPLSWAAGGGHEDVVKLLLGSGKANPDFTDKNG